MSHVLFPQRTEIATRRIDAALTSSQDEKQKEEGTRVESDWDEGCDQVGGRIGGVGVGARLTRLSAEDGMGEGIHGGGVHVDEVDEVVYDLQLWMGREGTGSTRSLMIPGKMSWKRRSGEKRGERRGKMTVKRMMRVCVEIKIVAVCGYE